MNELLEYMKGTLEGQAGLPTFSRWLHDNDAKLKQFLTPGSYLRLKHDPLPESRSILMKNEIDFSESEDAYLPWEPTDFSWIKADWLTEKLIPYRQSPTALAAADRIFLDELLHMVDLKRTGDELWRFASPEPTWAHLCGRAGIALVRDGRVIYAIVTMMN